MPYPKRRCVKCPELLKKAGSLYSQNSSLSMFRGCKDEVRAWNKGVTKLRQVREGFVGARPLRFLVLV